MRYSQPLHIPLHLRRDDPASLHDQLVGQVRAAILGRALAPGDRLPSTRNLARALGVSRSVVVSAFDALLSSGWLEARPGSGTFVARRQRTGAAASAGPSSPPQGRTSRLHPVLADLTPGQTGYRSFPVEAWRAAWRQASHHLDTAWDTSAHGSLELRTAVAGHLRQWRGVACAADQIVITTSVAHTVGLLAGSLVRPGDGVVVEDPCSAAIRDALTGHGTFLDRCPVDALGLVPQTLPDGAALAVVSAGHQFPTGAVLSTARRTAIVDWARDSGALVVEDDSGYEFCRQEPPPPTMLATGAPGQVAYTGSFDAVVAPLVRLSYVVTGRDLARDLRLRLERQAGPPPVLMQAAMAQLLREGTVLRHVRRLARQHAHSRELIRRAFGRHLPGAEVTGDAAGDHVVIRLPSAVSAEDYVHRLRGRGVVVPLMKDCAVGGADREDRLVLGYGHLAPDRLDQVLRLMTRTASSWRGAA
ncbi:MocR-like pyridoxine biosynthesis transcription factor PdxR [Actinomadura hibisca]|uniref:MocR-like pyridoxine biosynthesis transcription factor PdxR n=1 Tax=Actinomadura hibisca TaxID=68565 RepID=UPI00083547DD|nr:PLP-dependent aminotransferase family protein [Actinomadura hibisca]